MSLDNPPRGRSIGAIAFDLVLIAFCGLLVVNSLGLRPGVGLVPLLVGIPTLVVAVVLLALDVVPGAARAVDAGDEPAGGIQEMLATIEEQEADAAVDAGLGSRTRQLGFTLWVVAFVVLATFTSFYIAVPLALVVILAAVRLHWLGIVLVVVGTTAGFWALFGLFLGVRL